HPQSADVIPPTSGPADEAPFFAGGNWTGDVRDQPPSPASGHARTHGPRMARTRGERTAPAREHHDFANVVIEDHFLDTLGPPEDPMIRFENVTKVFGEGHTQVHALRDLTFDVPARQFCTIMGPSGSG